MRELPANLRKLYDETLGFWITPTGKKQLSDLVRCKPDAKDKLVRLFKHGADLKKRLETANAVTPEDHRTLEQLVKLRKTAMGLEERRLAKAAQKAEEAKRQENAEFPDSMQRAFMDGVESAWPSIVSSDVWPARGSAARAEVDLRWILAQVPHVLRGHVDVLVGTAAGTETMEHSTASSGPSALTVAVTTSSLRRLGLRWNGLTATVEWGPAVTGGKLNAVESRVRFHHADYPERSVAEDMEGPQKRRRISAFQNGFLLPRENHESLALATGHGALLAQWASSATEYLRQWSAVKNGAGMQPEALLRVAPWLEGCLIAIDQRISSERMPPLATVTGPTPHFVPAALQLP